MAALDGALVVLEAWPLAEAIRRSVWAYPALEIVHIVAFATVFGALMLLELRVFGAVSPLPLPPLAALAVPVALTAFMVAAVAGGLMFISSATELASNRAFQMKLGLIVVAGVNAWWFHRRGSLTLHDGLAKAQSLLSLLLWLGVIACGRLIAYI